MSVDKKYCMSSFLMFRTIADHTKCFREDVKPDFWDGRKGQQGIHDSYQLEDFLRMRVKQATEDGRGALALSGGIDSAILAKFMPKGSLVYTFKCVVPWMDVTDETPVAIRYAKECGLKHKIIEIYWEDFEKFAPILMVHKGMPIHSIEVQIYKAASCAKSDGMERLIFGEAADIKYGGFDGLLSKDWLIGEFIDRYTFVQPYRVLREPEMILEPYWKHVSDGRIDPHQFITDVFFTEAMNSYMHALKAAQIGGVLPYSETYLAEPLDYGRIRAGENKYLIRELFQRLYPGFSIPEKIPMPRPMNEWMSNWNGPLRPEFWPQCTLNMTGDQKWLVWALEKFLESIQEG